MKTIISIIIYFILSISISAYVYLFIYIKKKEHFGNREKNVENDGKMNFYYLNNKNYTTDVLQKYYVNDDTIVNWDGSTRNRINYHWFQNKLSNLPGYKYGYSGYLNSSLGNSSHKPYKNYSEYIYITYGVRL